MAQRAAAAIATAVATLLIVSSTVHAEGSNYKLLKLHGHLARWPAAPAAATTVSYAFVEGIVRHKGARNCGAMQPVSKALKASNISMSQFREEFVKATRMWEDAANIRFVEAGSPETADIMVGAQVKSIGRAFTNVELAERDGARHIHRSLICLNPDMPWKIGFDGNLSAYDLRYTLAHELGHAIGLDHPGKAGSLMFYKYDETQTGLTRGDMAGAAQIYGAGPAFAASSPEASGQTETAEASGADQGFADESGSSSFGLGAKP